jgi:hypothetical protein
MLLKFRENVTKKPFINALGILVEKQKSSPTFYDVFFMGVLCRDT